MEGRGHRPAPAYAWCRQRVGSGVPAKDYFDANASWSVTDTVSLRAGVNNFTDEQPALFSPGVQAGTDPSTYDVLGRRYYVGLTAKF